jgi:hypothetical protein
MSSKIKDEEVDNYYYTKIIIKIGLILIIVFLIYKFRKNILFYLSELNRPLKSRQIDYQRQRLLEDIEREDARRIAEDRANSIERLSSETMANAREQERLAKIEDAANTQRRLDELAYKIQGRRRAAAADARYATEDRFQRTLSRRAPSPTGPVNELWQRGPRFRQGPFQTQELNRVHDAFNNPNL